jgi:hypothetical protein
MLLLAHAGHILYSAPLFLAPVFVLGGALYVSASASATGSSGRGRGGAPWSPPEPPTLHFRAQYARFCGVGAFH